MLPMMKLKKINVILVFLLINVIEDVFGDQVEHMWHSYIFGTKFGNRQELVIKNVTTDDGFKYGINVTKWKTINLFQKTYAIGIANSSVTVLMAEYSDKEKRFVVQHKTTEIGKKPADVILYKDFGLSDKAEIIIILPINEENKPTVNWYRVTDKLKLEKLWDLKFHFYIVHVNYMFIDDKHLLILIDDEYKNSTVVEIYNFNLQRRQIMFQQLLQLSVTTDTTSFIQFGVRYFLAIPQKLKNSVLLYKYRSGKFTSFRNITGVSSTQVVSFKGGFNNYIAVNGQHSDIFQLNKYILSGAKVTAPLENIDYWLQIPARPYSDEPILFAQRLTNHGTHTSFSIDVILYHNEIFKLHEEMNCTFFGEKTNGANCIVEDEHSSGLKGSAVIGDGVHVGLLIPRKSGPSLLIEVNYGLKDLPDPVDVEVERFEITKELIEEAIQRKREDYAKEFVGKLTPMNLKMNGTDRDSTDSVTRTSQASVQEKDLFIRNVNQLLDNINNKIDNLQNKINVISDKRQKIQYNYLKVNGNVHVEGITNVKKLYANSLNGHIVNDILDDTVNLLTLKPIISRKEFDNLQINQLEIDLINGEKFDNVATKSKSLKFNGHLSFDKPVIITDDVSVASGLINGLSIKDEIVSTGTNNIQDTLSFEEVEFVNTINVGNRSNNKTNNSEHDTLYFDGNLSVHNINGYSLNDFLKRIIVKDINTNIPGNITINGTVTSNKTYTTYLNGLNFDSEYLFKDPNTSTSISGRKTFTGTVIAKEVSTSGLLNGINLNNVITLNNNQTLNGNFRFHDLEITEKLDIDGTVSRSEITKIKPKVALHQSDIIKSDINFKKLEVDGTVTISGNFNGNSFEDLLEDVVYKDVNDQEIEGVKQFNNGITIRDDLKIKSETINSIPIDSFISKDTEQILNMSLLNGIVSIENLKLDGYLNGINITELDQETVKLTGEQYVSSKLIFNDQIESDHLTVMEHLNKINVDEYVNNVSEDVIQFDKLHVENLEIRGNFETIYTNFDPKDYNNRRLSKTQNQTIEVPIYIENSNIDVLHAENINDYSYKDLFTWDLIHQIIDSKVQNGTMYLDTVVVNGSMYMNTINGANISLWSNCAKDVNPSRVMEFQEDVYFDNSLLINQLCGINFKEFAKNLIYKNETSVNLTMKEYIHGFEADNIYTDFINTINKYDILTKTDEQQIQAEIAFTGNVVVPDQVDIVETLNSVPMDYISETFEVSEDGYKINGDVFFERLVYVDNLNVFGLINNRNLTDVMENLVFIRDDMRINKNITFKGPVIITGNLTATNEINGINFYQLLQDIVFVNKFEYIEGVVIFNNLITTRKLEIDKDFDARFVMGIDLQTWKDNAIFIDRGLISGNIAFEKAIVSGLILTKYLNNMNTDSFIPLRSNQNISNDIFIDTMSSTRDIPVGNLINGYDLLQEYDNTLMNEADQIVSSPITFNENVIVRDFLMVNNLVNGINISRVITTNTDQNLTADYEFAGESILNKDLNVRGLVNGINISKWDEKAIKSNVKLPITVGDVWSVENNVTFYDKIDGKFLVNGLNITEIAKVSQEKNHFKNNIEQNLIENYNYMCKDIENFLDIAKRQIYSYKYFDHLLHIDFAYKVETVHNFVYKGNHFLLISGKNNCKSTLLLWKNCTFSPLKNIEIGSIKQIITAKIQDHIFLITKSNPDATKCKIQGTNIWKINDFFNIEPYYTLEDVNLLQDSIKPGTFYAIGKEYVIEYHLNPTKETVIKYKKWILHEDTSNMTFIPRGFETGLVLRSGNKIFKLKDPLTLDEFINEDEGITVGYTSSENNYILPGRYDGEVIPIEIGLDGNKIVAGVIKNQEFRKNQNSDFIMIYEDISRGKLLTKISSYKPSFLTTFRFDDNGETLLIFIEDNKMLQVYEYKGFEGFKHRQATSIEATQLFTVKLPMEKGNQDKYILGLVNGSKISLLEAVMDGHKIITNDLRCIL